MIEYRLTKYLRSSDLNFLVVIFIILDILLREKQKVVRSNTELTKACLFL